MQERRNMNIAVIGSGGREHAIAWKLSQSKLADEVFVLPGNGGTENNIDIDVNDFEQILNFCRHNTIQLVFVGPEDPLAAGIVDYFADTPVKVFGPDKAGAQLEGSKIYAKRFMKKYGVATGSYQDFCGIKTRVEAVKNHIGQPFKTAEIEIDHRGFVFVHSLTSVFL